MKRVFYFLSISNLPKLLEVRKSFLEKGLNSWKVSGCRKHYHLFFFTVILFLVFFTKQIPPAGKSSEEFNPFMEKSVLHSQKLPMGRNENNTTIPIDSRKNIRSSLPTRGHAPFIQESRAGFSIHFDFITSYEDAEKLLEFAYQNGAKILNVIPPPHVWQNPLDLKILKRVFQFANTHGIKIVLTRIDASRVNGPANLRDNDMYSFILNQTGVLPSGKKTPRFFCNPVGNPAFIKWQKEETLYYAKHFSHEPCLIGFSIGMFNEPFVSQRGSLLCFDEQTNSYEIAQYTPYGLNWWHKFLEKEFCNQIKPVNLKYGTSFSTIDEIPMPKNESDERFGKPFNAYWDLVRSLNYWVVSQYETCRAIWHKHRKKNIPFILQFSGYEPEKLEKGRVAFAALDLFDWMKRADALGMSMYANAEYGDHGHDSDRSLIRFLHLGNMMRKPVYILECGYEDNGAVIDESEFDFFVSLTRELQPQCINYEFLKMSYDEAFNNHSGKLIDNEWKVNETGLQVVKSFFERSRISLPSPSYIYVYDEPEKLQNSQLELKYRKEMIKMAYQKPIVFIPKGAVSLIPSGSTLVVPKPCQSSALLKILKSRNIFVMDTEALLGASDGQEPF